MQKILSICNKHLEIFFTIKTLDNTNEKRKYILWVLRAMTNIKDIDQEDNVKSTIEQCFDEV